MNKQNLSYLFAFLSILAWSSVSTAFKINLKYFTPLGLLIVSSWTASITLAVVYFASKPKKPYQIGKNLWQSIPKGFLNPFAYYLVLFTAYSRLRAQEAQALNYTWAIVLSVLSALILKEKLRLKDVAALCISFFGVVIISSKGQLLHMKFDDPFGTFLAAGSSIIWALYWIISIKDTRTGTVKLMYNFLIGSILITLFGLISGQSLITNLYEPLPAYLSGIYIGLFEMGITFILWLKAMEYTDNTAKISNLIFITPFLSLVFINFLLGESIHPATVIGLFLIVGSNLYQRFCK